MRPALWASPDDFVLKLFGLPPLPDARQTEAVIAVGKNTEPGTALLKRLFSTMKIFDYLASPFGLSRTVSMQMPHVFSLLLATAKLSSISLSCS